MQRPKSRCCCRSAGVNQSSGPRNGTGEDNDCMEAEVVGECGLVLSLTKCSKDKFLSVIDGLGGSDLILFGEGFWRDLASQSWFFLSWMYLQ